MYTMEYYSAIRKDEYPPFALTWMELEGIMLSEDKWFLFFYWSSICQHLAKHPMHIPSSAPLSTHHPVTPPRPPPLPPPLVHFPELGVSHVLSPFLIFPTHFFSFPLYSLVGSFHITVLVWGFRRLKCLLVGEVQDHIQSEFVYL